MPIVPELSSPSWAATAEPLRIFLESTSATIKEVLLWARQIGLGGEMGRSALAWLSLAGKAYYDDHDGKWKAGCILKPSDIYEPSPTPKIDPFVRLDRILRILDSRVSCIPGASPDLKITWPLPMRRKSPSPVRTITFGGETLTILQWARKTNLSASTIAGRLAMGWPPEKIVGEPYHTEKLHSITRPLVQTEEDLRKPARTITIGDKTQTLCQWEKETGISFSTLSGRLARGWPPERMLEKPRRREPVQMALDLQGPGKI